MKKFSLTLQNFFEGFLMNFLRSSRNQSLCEKMSLDKEGKNAKAPNIFSYYAKIFA